MAIDGLGLGGSDAGRPMARLNGRASVAALSLSCMLGLTVVVVGSAAARAETMSGALSLAYGGNPDLNQQRAGVRATDETLPQATAAYRPTVGLNGQYGVTHLAEVGTGAVFGGVTGGAGAETGFSFSTLTEPATVGLTVIADRLQRQSQL